MNSRDRGNLAIEKRGWPAVRREARPLDGVPARGALSVWEYTYRTHDFRHETLELGAAPRARQTLDAEPHLVRDNRGSHELAGVLGKGALDPAVRLRLGESGEDIGIE